MQACCDGNTWWIVPCSSNSNIHSTLLCNYMLEMLYINGTSMPRDCALQLVKKRNYTALQCAQNVLEFT